MSEYHFKITPLKSENMVRLQVFTADETLIVGERYVGDLWFFPVLRIRKAATSIIKDFESRDQRLSLCGRIESELNAKTGS